MSIFNEEAVRLLREIRDALRVLPELREGLADLISTTRFSRGDFLGPITDNRNYITKREPTSIFDGAVFPVAMFIECPGTGKSTDFLYIGPDPTTLRAGIKIPLDRAMSIANGNPLRVVCDRHQRMYAAADIIQAEQVDIAGNPLNEFGELGGEVELRVYYARN